MNLTYLSGNATFLLGKGFWKCRNKNVQCHTGDFALELVASAVQNLQIQRDKGLIVFAISDSIVIVLDNSALNVPCCEFAGCNQTFVHLLHDLRPFRFIGNVVRIFKDAVWHFSIL